MIKMEEEIEMIEQAIVARNWDGEIEKTVAEIDWQGRQNDNYRLKFRLKDDKGRLCYACIEYNEKPLEGRFRYKVTAKLMGVAYEGKHLEFEKAKSYFLKVVDRGFFELSDEKIIASGVWIVGHKDADAWAKIA